MNKKIILLAVTVSVTLGLGASVVFANPTAEENTTKLNTSHVVPTNTKTTVDVVEQSENTNPASTSRTTGQTAISSDSQSSLTQASSNSVESNDTEEIPAPVIVQTGTKRVVTFGMHKDYYCDLVYSDQSEVTIKLGESNDTEWGKVTLSITCDQYIGQAKS